MSSPPDRTRRLTSLFEAVTGQSTVTEEQRTDRPVRFADGTGADCIERYISAALRDDGLDDAVPEPEPY